MVKRFHAEKAAAAARGMRDAAWELIDRAAEIEATGRLPAGSTMTKERAFEISDRLRDAELVLWGIQPGPVPSLADVSLNQALEAVRIVKATPPIREADGSTTHHLRVELAGVPDLLACAIKGHKVRP